jgi:hypothetical protein
MLRRAAGALGRDTERGGAASAADGRLAASGAAPAAPAAWALLRRAADAVRPRRDALHAPAAEAPTAPAQAAEADAPVLPRGLDAPFTPPPALAPPPAILRRADRTAGAQASAPPAAGVSTGRATGGTQRSGAQTALPEAASRDATPLRQPDGGTAPGTAAAPRSALARAPEQPAHAPAAVQRPLARLRLAGQAEAARTPAHTPALGRTSALTLAAAGGGLAEASPDEATVHFAPPPAGRLPSASGLAATLARATSPGWASAAPARGAGAWDGAPAAVRDAGGGARALARVEAEEGAAPPASAPPGGGGGRAPAAHPQSADDVEMERDGMYEAMLDRLRRDLLMERERMGDLVGDLL